MTLIAYYEGCLIADRLHNNDDIPWAHVKSREDKITISQCGRAAMAVTGPAYGASYRQELIDAIVVGIAKWEGDLALYLNFLYSDDDDIEKQRHEMFRDFGNFSMIVITSTGAFSISRHTDNPADLEVMPRRYDHKSIVAYGTGATAFLMLGALSTPLHEMTKIIAMNDALVSPEYDCVDSVELKPFKRIIRAKKD